MSEEEARVEMRKLRKKLRQIENLERLERDLNDEEIEKVLKKDGLRAQLKNYLLEYPAQYDSSFNSNLNNASTTSSNPDTSRDFSVLSQQQRQFYDDEDGRQDYEEEEDEDEDEEEEEEEEEEKHANEEEDNGAWETVPVQKDTQQSKVPSQAQGDGQTKPKPQEKMKPEKAEKTKEAKVTKTDSSKVQEGTKKKAAGKGEGRDKGGPDKEWRKHQWSVVECTGHNDLVCSVAMDGDVMVTGSRDTTVKLWKMSTGQEIRSFGGHSMCVSTVLLLSPHHSKQILSDMEKPEDHHSRIIVSASHDCHIKLWSTSTGEQLLSIYTYNPVTCLAYVSEKKMIVSGSDGGKLEVWDAVSGKQLHSLKTQEEAAFTGLQFCAEHLVASTADGLVRVYRFKPDSTPDSSPNPAPNPAHSAALQLLFVSEDVRLGGASAGGGGATLIRRYIRSLAATPTTIYYGDDGLNVKALRWKEGEVRKLANHLGDFGSTDALCTCNDLLLSSGYDLDNGMGYINVRRLSTETYLASLCDEDTSRIVAMAALATQDGRLRFATAGMELKVWQQEPVNPTANSTAPLSSHFLAPYARSAPRHSDIDSDADSDAPWSSDDDDDGVDGGGNGGEGDTPAPFRRRRGGEGEEAGDGAGGWMSWCSIL